jgi:hypothetical protein
LLSATEESTVVAAGSGGEGVGVAEAATGAALATTTGGAGSDFEHPRTTRLAESSKMSVVFIAHLLSRECLVKL